MALRTIKKVLKETPLIGRVINSLTSDNPEENAPSIQAVKDNMAIRPNLLDNADFRYGVINQQGKTSYSGNAGSKIYTIDRWYTDGLSITVNNGSIGIVNTHSDEYEFSQYVDKAKEASNYTIFVYIYRINLGSAKLVLYGLNGDEILRTEDLRTGSNLFTVFSSRGISRVSIKCNVCNIWLSYIKLEKGNTYTGMIELNATDELIKCQRYSLYGNLFGVVSTYVSGSISFVVPIPVTLRKNPTITNNVEGNSSNGLTVRNAQGSVVTGFTFSVANGPFANSVVVTATKANHGLTFDTIGTLTIRGTSGFDANDY